MRAGLTGRAVFAIGRRRWRGTGPLTRCAAPGGFSPGGGAAELELLGGHTADEYFALELEDLFRELEPADRELLLERYFYGASPAEAAAKRGVSVSAVNTRVSRAKTRLAQTLERSGKR